jgi:hypothetical protein
VGKYAQAVATLEKSLPGNASNGFDVSDLFFLAMCHYRLGDAAKAREYFERAKTAQQRDAGPGEVLEEIRNEPATLSRDFKQFRNEAKTLLGQPAEKR